MKSFAKKFVMMIAALSLCSCAFVACDSDDDSNDNNNNNNNQQQQGNGDQQGSGDQQGGAKAANGSDCLYDADCESNFCDADHKCAVKDSAAKDPCAGVTCTEGACNMGICVTDAMKEFKDGDGCSEDSFTDFCNGDIAVQCSGTKVIAEDCKAADAGTCTVAENNGAKVAFCSGNADMINRCKANEEGEKKATIALCYGNEEWSADVICVTDVTNKLVAYAKGIHEDCGVDGKCSYNEDGAPVCSK